MAEKYEHLLLPFVSSDPRKKPRAIITRVERGDKHKFYSDELNDLDEIQQKHSERKRKYQKYLDPKLIFKLEVNQNVPEETFRGSLRGIDFDVISASPDKKGYWIVFADDENFIKFKEKLQQYSSSDNRYKFFDTIGKLQDIPPSEKIGESLREEPFKDDELSSLDVGIWRMKDSRLWDFLPKFYKYIDSIGGELLDKLVTKQFCRLRIIANKQIYSDILELSEVAFVDRPPKIILKLGAELDPDIEEFDFGVSPSENAAGILVVDSGILARHPMLENAVGDENSIATKYSQLISEDKPFDDVGHGTKVAGFALYGDIQTCKDRRIFDPEVWIFSAKVMYKNESGDAVYDERELLEHQLYSAVKWVAKNYPNCKVVNLSLGNCANKMIKGMRQFDLSTLIDDLSNELDLIFVVSCGNIDGDIEEFENYPNYLLTSDEIKIIDPAPSALALTVGALCKNNSGKYYPSPITRTGPGYKGMIKPELVEDGGGFGSKVLTINPNWITDGRLFTLDVGTSFSTPKVAHYIARLVNKFPEYSTNMVKALLISSAEIPPYRPQPLSEINMYNRGTNEGDIMDLLNVYGYGKPNLEKALNSSKNQVILMNESRIKLNDFHIYSFYLPKEFIEERGNKRLSVTLVFNPPVNKNRSDYLGVIMEAHLFKQSNINLIREKYGNINIDDITEDIVPDGIKRNEIKTLRPGINTRKRGVHQKGVIEYKLKPRIDLDQPIALVIICKDRWVKYRENRDDETYLQDYAVVVSVEHSEEIDLYNQIRLKNRARLDISWKT